MVHPPPSPTLSVVGFKVYGEILRVYGSGCKVHGSWFGVSDTMVLIGVKGFEGINATRSHWIEIENCV